MCSDYPLQPKTRKRRVGAVTDLDLVNITPEFLKERLSSDETKRTGTPEEKQKVDDLHRRIRSRVQEGMSRNLTDWQWIYAIDKAWDTPFRQFHPKLFCDLEGGNLDACCTILKDLNMGSLVTTTKGADGKDVHTVDEDKFQLLVGLVRSYTTIRWAKIVNDRRLIPFLKYEPAKATAINRTKCEILTDRVQVMSTQYAYFEAMKQSVLKMLQYGTCIQFIKEEWDIQYQAKKADQSDVDEELRDLTEGQTAKVKIGDAIEVVEREGLRYDHPHLSRVYVDLNHPKYTINSDSGVEFGGYWQILRFRDVKKGFWNTDRVSIGSGTNALIDYNNLYFQTAYNACKMAQPRAAVTSTTELGGGASTADRETQLTNQWYGSDHDDQGVLVTHHFEKLVPKENGLGDYNYPVWFRFVLAGDGCTILYAAPLPGNPMVYYGYDADESRSKNASLAMEILPYQYQFENLLSQIIYSCKQNLSNLTLVNTDILDDKEIDKIYGWGTKLWKKVNLVGASFKRLMKLTQSNASRSQDMGMSLTLPKANIAELVNVLKTVLDVLERVLVMSSHEVAQAASHEQTREEVRNIASSTSSRLTFTATPVDIARDAWKRQIYIYLMAYGEVDFYGHIPAENEITEEQLKNLKFSFVDDDSMVGKEKFRRVRAKKESVALPLYEFASTRDGEDRSSDAQVAGIMATFYRDLLSNPMTASAIGPDQAIDLANQIAYYAGLPRDFKLRNTGKTPEEQKAEAQQQLQQVIEIVLKATDERMIKAITPVLENIKTLNQEVAVIMRATGIAPPQSQSPDAGNQPNPPA